MVKRRVLKWSWIGVFALLFSSNLIGQCIDTSLINTSANCPNFEQPVCGCDGVTYTNHCIAENHYGITEWTYGPCSTQSCAAYFSYETAGEYFTFFNESFGDYEYSEWDFGNELSLLSGDAQVNYQYTENGFYTVCLTVSNADGCSSTYCDEVFDGNWEDVCSYTDCVYPGDADGDGAANIYDLLNIGVGYGKTGFPRESAELEWGGQYSPNWGQMTISGLDFKHLDCDGNGVINELDVNAINANYSAAENVVEITESGAPNFWLDIEVDSVIIDDNSPMFLSFSIDLMAGTLNNPMEDLKGFALTINYPEDIVQDGSVEVDYYDNSFLGISNEIVWLPKDRPEVGKLDLAFVQKGDSKTGSGKIATINYIIIVDIIDRNESYMTLDIPIEGEASIGQSGAFKAIGITEEEAQFTIVNVLPNATKEAIISDKISVYPNPTSDVLMIELGGLKGDKIEIFNSLGQHVLSQTINNNPINLGHLSRGVYSMKIHTSEGVGFKKVILN